MKVVYSEWEISQEYEYSLRRHIEWMRRIHTHTHNIHCDFYSSRIHFIRNENSL